MCTIRKPAATTCPVFAQPVPIFIGKNTKPELIVRSFLHRNGFRFRLHDKKLPGKPDIVLKKYKTVIFVQLLVGVLNNNYQRI